MISSPCVYILKPSFSIRSYIGSTLYFNKRFNRHINELEKGIHHNVLFQEAWNKNPITSMGVSIINTDTLEAAKQLEKDLINKLIKTGCLFNIVNAAVGGDAITFHPNRQAIANRHRFIVNERMSKMSNEEKKKIWSRPGDKNGMYGKTHSLEARKNISEKNKGRISTNKGIPLTDAVKRILSEKAKLKIGKLNPFFGKRHSDEYKKKASLLRLGIPNLACSKPVSIDGIKYSSVQQASKILNINPLTLRHRTISKNKKFISYFYTN